jgi:uncharacterized protein (TIGR02145 family)
MKKITLIVLMLFTVLSYAQGEQLYADGTASDQEGNSFEWIDYGTQDWAIENAEVVTYRDGTSIPQVTDEVEWQSLTTGAWCYVNNDPTKRKLYNWYAVAGIHDTDSSTPKKEFTPVGWRVSNESDWLELKDYLISNGYNFDSTSEGNKIAKSIASTTGWAGSSNEGAAGNDQSSNNRSGFNAFPDGFRELESTFKHYGVGANFWVWMVNEVNTNPFYGLANYGNYLQTNFTNMKEGLSVRFVRDVSTASKEKHQSNLLTIYPNPTNNTLFISGNETPITVSIYNVLGKELLSIKNTNNINVQALPSGVYVIRISDGVGQTNRKFIKN